MLRVSHHLHQSASALVVFSIPAAVFWPYFVGAATLVIGLGTSIKNRIGQASGFNKFILFGPLLFAIAMAVFGADHFVTTSFVAKIVPSWIPGHVFWAYLTGAIFLGRALGLPIPQIRPFLAAALLGITVLVLLAYLPLTITKASDVANGLNYLAIHFALAGAAFSLPELCPPRSLNLPPFLKSSDPVFASRRVLKRSARYHRA